MTPLGYFRKVETFALWLRDTPEDERNDADLDRLVNAIDQAWSELNHTEHLLVYNVVQFINQNIKPAKGKEPEAPRIQLLN